MRHFQDPWWIVPVVDPRREFEDRIRSYEIFLDQPVSMLTSFGLELRAKFPTADDLFADEDAMESLRALPSCCVESP